MSKTDTYIKRKWSAAAADTPKKKVEFLTGVTYF